MIKPPKAKKEDEESQGDKAVPGSPNFAAAYRQKIDDFYRSKDKRLDAWCAEHGIDLPTDFRDSNFLRPENLLIKDEHIRERYQRQLFFMLYLEYLLWRAAKAVLDVDLWADEKKQQGRLDRWRLIFPGSKTLYKWARGLLSKEDFTQDSSFVMDMHSGSDESIDLGEDFTKRKDPEHLPPANVLERLGDSVRSIPEFFRGDNSAFGFRVACATMTIGITCFLEASQTFFIEQRLLWAMIMVGE